MTRKSTLSPESAAIVSHLKQHGAATLDALLGHFPAEGRSKLRKRLSNLYDGNWLDIAWAADGEMLWLVAPGRGQHSQHCQRAQATRPLWSRPGKST